LETISSFFPSIVIFILLPTSLQIGLLECRWLYNFTPENERGYKGKVIGICLRAPCPYILDKSCYLPFPEGSSIGVLIAIGDGDLWKEEEALMYRFFE
jgi:hypothetical protein